MFEYLETLKVTADKKAEITLYDITLPNGEHPILEGRVAGEINKQYFNALLNIQLKRNNAAKKTVTAEMLAETRSDDRELFSKYVITGWKHITDSKGDPVEFTKEHCEEFLNVLPDHVFDQVRNFFSNQDHFMGDTPTDKEIEETGKD